MLLTLTRTNLHLEEDDVSNRFPLPAMHQLSYINCNFPLFTKGMAPTYTYSQLTRKKSGSGFSGPYYVHFLQTSLCKNPTTCIFSETFFFFLIARAALTLTLTISMFNFNFNFSYIETKVYFYFFRAI